MEQLMTLIQEFYNLEDDLLSALYDYISAYESYNATINYDLDYLKNKIKIAVIRGTRNE